MLGFTLSKINLLIFVVAVFSIILFFMYGFSGILVQNIATDYIRIHTQDAFTLVGSPSLCAAQIHFLKDSIESSSGNTGRGMYYVINIKKGQGKEGMNKLIFALAPRKNPENYIAASSFDVNAEIVFFDFEKLKNGDPSMNDSNTLLDPQALFPSNAYVILKEVNLGETTIYVIPCSNRSGADCYLLLQKAGDEAKGGEGFNCSFE
jgi:hypothetical protein